MELLFQLLFQVAVVVGSAAVLVAALAIVFVLVVRRHKPAGRTLPAARLQATVDAVDTLELSKRA